MRTLGLGVGWAAVAATALLLLLRWLPVTNTPLLAVIGVIPLLIVPLLIAVAVAAWWSRGRPLRVGAVVIAAVAAVSLIRPSAVVACGPTDDANALVVYSHNVLWSNTDADSLGTALVEVDPDVILLQELSPALRWDLERDDAFADYAKASDSIDDKIQMALWSRWPLTDVALTEVAGRPHLSATVLSPDGEFRLHNIHLSAPVDDRRADAWDAGLRHLDGVSADEPAVMSGDFNATIHHARFRSLLRSGWTDVHEPKGCGFDATWPADDGRVMPVLQLDHTLVSDHWDVLSVEIGDALGADHHAVISRIRLADGAADADGDGT
ncbi:MAG: endonuclease/exonuclease/phosphatase family protein [Actinomycetota bacterium]